MSFFNKKEEVINIELTPYGKHLLSKGKWKPAYYEFYDDDIVYDSQYAGYVEKQELTQQRISDTARAKVQYSFEGADKRYKQFIEKFLEARSDLQNLMDNSIEKRKNFSLSSLPLANSSLKEDKTPAWAINVFRGQIDEINTDENIVGLPNNLYKLLFKKTDYKLTVDKRKEQKNAFLGDNEQTGNSSDLNILHKTFEDDTYIKVDEDFILLHIKEENVDILKENFDMFIYEIETDPKTGQEIEKPLLFKKKKNNVINNILIDETGEDIEGYEGPKYASHYFNIYVDKEIDSDLLAKYLNETEKKSLSIADGYVFRETSEQGQQIIASPQLESITDREIDDFEDCE